MNWHEYFDKLTLWATTNGFRIVLILCGMLLGFRVAKLASLRLYKVLIWKNEKNSEILKRAQTFSSFTRYLIATIIVATAAIMILTEIGIEVRPILAGAGIVGLAVGFGAQNLVQDVISGFFILLEDQIRVGDVVNLNGKGGLVEKVGLRMTVLRDFDGAVHYVRNGKIDIVTNMTKEFSNYVFNVRIAYDEDVDRIIAIMRQIDAELRNDEQFKDLILAPLEISGVDEFGESAVLLKARIRTLPIKQWEVGREFNKRMKKKFEQEKVIIAFPNRVLHISEEGGRKLAAANVQPAPSNLR
ncbi:MAG: mechanosensitive ion channel family protein [Verrucomicrobiales bacterium]